MIHFTDFPNEKVAQLIKKIVVHRQLNKANPFKEQNCLNGFVWKKQHQIKKNIYIIYHL